jgi:hypothetical protein
MVPPAPTQLPPVDPSQILLPLSPPDTGDNVVLGAERGLNELPSIAINNPPTCLGSAHPGLLGTILNHEGALQCTEFTMLSVKQCQESVIQALPSADGHAFPMTAQAPFPHPPDISYSTPATVIVPEADLVRPGYLTR